VRPGAVMDSGLPVSQMVVLLTQWKETGIGGDVYASRAERTRSWKVHARVFVPWGRGDGER